MQNTQPHPHQLPAPPPPPQREPLRPKSQASSTESPQFSTGAFSDDRPPIDGQPLSQESERIRASVPGTIGDDFPPSPAETVEELEDPEILSRDEGELRELMASFAFEEEDVKEQLAELCDWLAEILKAEHWKLTDRQKRMIGRPITLLLNSLWVKLQDYLPRFFAAWCEQTPGLFASMTACTFVFGPKLMKQIKLNRERRSQRQVPPPGAPAAPRSSRPVAQPVGPAIVQPVQDAPPTAEESGSHAGITWD